MLKFYQLKSTTDFIHETIIAKRQQRDKRHQHPFIEFLTIVFVFLI